MANYRTGKRAIIADGAEAFRSGATMDDNPQEQGSREQAWWWQGFLDARFPLSKYDFPKSKTCKPQQASAK